jgi:hypothetical protein
VTLRDELLKRAKAMTAGRPGETIAWASDVLTLLELLRGPNHGLTQTLQRALDATVVNKAGGSQLAHTAQGLAAGLVSDLEAGLIPDLQSRIRSEVEGGFLGQAMRLLDDGLKDPAAMLIGAVLEDGLRQLCSKHGVPEGSTIETMNEPLRQKAVYGLPQKQQVTAWAAIRNKADHGRFSEYTEAEVRLMHQGVLGFIAQHLAP